jgi:hypothetical protein
MKLRTKVDVTYNYGIAATETGIVEGHLQDTAWMNDFNTIGANYTYTDTSGNVLFRNGFTIEGDQIETLWTAIEDSIPEGLNYRDTTRYKFYLGFIFEMAQTFGIATTDIEIVE